MPGLASQNTDHNPAPSAWLPLNPFEGGKCRCLPHWLICLRVLTPYTHFTGPRSVNPTTTHFPCSIPGSPCYQLASTHPSSDSIRIPWTIGCAHRVQAASSTRLFTPLALRRVALSQSAPAALPASFIDSDSASAGVCLWDYTNKHRPWSDRR
jgi:hypothetical protein